MLRTKTSYTLRSKQWCQIICKKLIKRDDRTDWNYNGKNLYTLKKPNSDILKLK